MDLFEKKLQATIEGSSFAWLKFVASYAFSRLIVLVNSIIDIVLLLLMNYLITYWCK